ncbi:MAG TPA: hypothetical protein PL033_06365 [Candidatus Brocadiia bacterium]|nr:hypothetical protein [Candidatus Brocadiia bacterium]
MAAMTASLTRRAMRRATLSRWKGKTAPAIFALAVVLCGCGSEARNGGSGVPTAPAVQQAAATDREPARQKEPRALYEEAGGFSYDPPSDWRTVKLDSSRFRAAAGPATAFYAPNITVFMESYPAPLEAYADASVKAILAKAPDAKTVGREAFRTDDGEAAVRVATERTTGDVLLRQTFYFFRGTGDNRYVATCTSRADENEILEAAFEKSMKSFRIH